MSEKSNNNPMRLCLISFRSYPLFNPAAKGTFGGAELDSYWIATELAKDPQFEITVIVGDYGQPNRERVANVTLIKSINDERNLFLQARKIWRAMAIADADVYLAECMSLGMVLYAYYCERNRKTFIYRTASIGECDGTYFRQHRCRAFAIRWALKKADRILAQNTTDAKNLKMVTGLDSVVVRNMLPIMPIAPSKNETILWVGRSDPMKQPQLFLDLAQSIPDQSFTMICSKYLHDPHYESLQWRAEKIPNLEFVPGISHDKIVQWFGLAKMFVNTSIGEGFPNTFLEACGQGIPIVSLNADPDGFLEKYRCGLCAKGDWDRLLHGIRELLDPEKAKQMGQNAREYVKSYHDVNLIVAQYKEILKSYRRN